MNNYRAELTELTLLTHMEICIIKCNVKSPGGLMVKDSVLSLLWLGFGLWAWLKKKMGKKITLRRGNATKG